MEPSIRNLKDAPSPEELQRPESLISSGRSLSDTNLSPLRHRRLLTSPDTSFSLLALPDSDSQEDEQKRISSSFREEDLRQADPVPDLERKAVSFREEDLIRVARRRPKPTVPLSIATEEVDEEKAEIHDDDDDYTVHSETNNRQSETESDMFTSPVQNWIQHQSRIPKCIKTPPGWSRIAGFVVRYAPCFWCFFCWRRLETSATDRAILVRLNILCCVFAAGQMVSAILLMFLAISNSAADRTIDIDDGIERSQSNLFLTLWNSIGAIFFAGIFGLIIFVVMIITRPVVQQVNLAGAVRYMWCLLWIIPIEVYFVVSMFDLHDLTTVWVKHYWATMGMAWYRKVFCQTGTANEECVVPINGGELYRSEEHWCEVNFNRTDCRRIRNVAQGDADTASNWFYTVNGIWGVMFIFLLFLTVKLLEGIITRPIVQSSRESNVPAWLTLPTIGCVATASVFLFTSTSALSDETVSENSWIAIVYFVTGGLFGLGALLGWGVSTFSILNNRDKRTKMAGIILFIMVMGITLVAVFSIFVFSIVQSVNLVDVPITDSERGRIACSIDTVNSCSYCDNTDGRRECPEWTTSDVVSVLRAQLKQAATFAAICCVYAFSALRFGLMFRKHVAMYQIDYV